MIINFKKFNEMVSAQDTKNMLNFNIEKGSVQGNINTNDKNIQKLATLKITDINNRIKQIEEQKKLINNEIIKLQNAQRDLAPNNPNDPKNAEKLKIFVDDQSKKIEIQKQKIDILNKEIENLKNEVERHKSNYM